MKQVGKNLLFSLVTIIFCVVIIEITCRAFLSPSQKSFGMLFNIELVPFELPSPATPPLMNDRTAWYENLIVNDQKITVGDLWGIARRDPKLGYVPLEATISRNGWWQSNNLGAKARRDTTTGKSSDNQRMLVFGDSYAAGNRVPQEKMWSAVLDSRNTDLDVINFAVDGYGMGQSYLRYLSVRNKLDYDTVVLMFVPSSDLWRDINVRRDLMEWEVYWIMPRFMVEDDTLILVDNPFADLAITTDNEDVIDSSLRKYLASFDRFYFRSKYEDSQLLGWSILYKLWATAYYRLQRREIFDGLFQPESEALLVSQKIFAAMNEEVKAEGKDFVLIILPRDDDLNRMNQDDSFAQMWERMTMSTCSSSFTCIDLSEAMSKLPVSELDQGYDGSHYGPRTNRLIAELIEKKLRLAGAYAKKPNAQIHN